MLILKLSKSIMKDKMSFYFLWTFTNILGFLSLFHFPTNWIIDYLHNQSISEFQFTNSISFLFNSFLFAFIQSLLLYFFLQKKLAMYWFLRTWIALIVAYIISMFFLSLVFAKFIFPLLLDILVDTSYHYSFFIGVQVTAERSVFIKSLVILLLSVYYSIGIGPVIGLFQGTLISNKQSSKRWMINVTFSFLIGLSINSLLISFIPKMIDFNILYQLFLGIVYSIFTVRGISNYRWTINNSNRLS